jgi:hypothetical protein
VDVPVVALGGGRHGAFVGLFKKQKHVKHLVVLSYCMEWLSGGEARRHVADQVVLSGRVAARGALRDRFKRKKQPVHERRWYACILVLKQSG